MHRRKTVAVTAVGAAALAGAVALTSPAASASSSAEPHHDHHGKQVDGGFVALNNSGVTGRARITVKGDRLWVAYTARGLVEGMPHAAHVHFAADARNACPTAADDTNGDFRLTTSEGQPAYGMIRKSLTVRGDTSPASALAVTRFPTAPNGTVHYKRWIPADSHLAQAIRAGKAVIVVHGVDYNANGAYDFDSAGASDIDGSLPAEATDPAACALLD